MKKRTLPEEIIVGGIYRNFRGYERIALYVFEHENATKITYDDHTGSPKTRNRHI